MDPYGNKIRELKGVQGPLRFDEETSNAIGSYSARCRNRNLRGECANPNLTGEYGMMSWREYDELKAQGKDPEEVSHYNRNKRRPWLESPWGPRRRQA